MTLTELKYIVAVAREKHFGRAAEACFISQPTLSVAIRKLEEELGVQIFERGGLEIGTTTVGQQIVMQAQRVLEQTGIIKELALQGVNPLSGSLRIGAIFTVAPYLFPVMIKNVVKKLPEMPLLLEESYTQRLLESLRQGMLDVAIMAQPFSEAGLRVHPLYDEPFVVAMSTTHPWASKKEIQLDELRQENVLLLGDGHCFRDQIMDVCPDLMRFSQVSDGIHRVFEGSSLETIRNMVAAGVGITVMPRTAIPKFGENVSNGMGLPLAYVPFASPVPNRRIVLAWRKSFPRLIAIEQLVEIIQQSQLVGARSVKVPFEKQKKI